MSAGTFPLDRAAGKGQRERARSDRCTTVSAISPYESSQAGPEQEQGETGPPSLSSFSLRSPGSWGFPFPQRRPLRTRSTGEWRRRNHSEQNLPGSHSRTESAPSPSAVEGTFRPASGSLAANHLRATLLLINLPAAPIRSLPPATGRPLPTLYRFPPTAFHLPLPLPALTPPASRGSFSPPPSAWCGPHLQASSFRSARTDTPAA